MQTVKRGAVTEQSLEGLNVRKASAITLRSTSTVRTTHQRFLAALVLLCAGCRSGATESPPRNGVMANGTWGGDGAGVIVDDSITHVRIGCTYGDIVGRVTLDANGRFSRNGGYLLSAFPIVLGPTMPALFSGRVSGDSLTLTVAVSDTVNNMIVVRGAVRVRLGATPQLAPCPR